MSGKAFAPPDTPEACLEFAMRHHQQGDLYSAQRYYSEALRLAPDHVQALRLRGIVARERGDIAASVADLRRAAELAPDNPLPRSELGLTYMHAGELEAAETELRAARRSAPDAIDTLAHLAALMQHRGHLSEAIDLCRKILELESEETGIRCNLAKALMDAGRSDDAFAELEAAGAKRLRHPLVLATRGALLVDAGRYAEALEPLRAAVGHAPDDGMARVNLALALTETGATDEAIAELQRALQNDPYNARAAGDLVMALSRAGRDYESVELAERFLEVHPGEPIVIGSYAQALQNAGKAEAAASLMDYDRLVRRYTLPAAAGFDTTEALNAALERAILGDPSLLRDPRGKSTLGGEQTGEFNTQSSDALAAFIDAANRCVREAVDDYREAGLADHPVMARAADRWSLRAWGTVLRAGGRQTPHMHPLGWLSAVYYVAVPDLMDRDEDHAGWLEFGAPPERHAVRSRLPVHRVKPRPGELHLFPSWFWHRTLPFAGEGTRISIAFDVMPQDRLRPL